MSTAIRMPPTTGKVVKIHRQPGFHVNKGEAIVDVQLAETHRLTLCAPFEGKIMRCREVGYVLDNNELVTEITGVGEPTWELFVAYRRNDSPGHAGRVGERLISHFGAGQVFKDIEALPLGVDFPSFIREKLQLAFAMAVVIGPGWVQQRLHDPKDLHREEIRTALERGIYILPVRVNGAAMPHEDEVPEDIRPFVRRLAVEITDTRWDYDAGRMVASLEKELAASPRRAKFLAQVPPWGHTGPQWIMNDPGTED